MADPRRVTLDANDRIIANDWLPIEPGNPRHMAKVTLAPSHEDYFARVGERIIP